MSSFVADAAGGREGAHAHNGRRASGPHWVQPRERWLVRARVNGDGGVGCLGGGQLPQLPERVLFVLPHQHGAGGRTDLFRVPPIIERRREHFWRIVCHAHTAHTAATPGGHGGGIRIDHGLEQRGECFGAAWARSTARIKCAELEVHDVDRMDVRCFRVVSVPMNKWMTENQGWNPGLRNRTRIWGSRALNFASDGCKISYIVDPQVLDMTSCRFNSNIITLEYPFRAVSSCRKRSKISSQLDFVEQILALTAKPRGSALSDLKTDEI